MALFQVANAKANNPYYLEEIPSTYQEVNFVKETLETYLEPIGLDLRIESLDINSSISLPHFPRLVKIRTPHYIVKSVLFSAIEPKSQKKLFGSTYLIIASKNAESDLKIEHFNSTAKKFQTISQFGHDEFYLLLSRDIDALSLSADISPIDFNLN
jgi:hypothetical protein